MKRKWNWPLWVGFVVAVGGLFSYEFFAQFPITRDFPWANLLLFCVGAILLGLGLVRAFGRPHLYRGKIFGPIFATPTKPDYPPIGLSDIARVHESVRIPIFCIGGIKLDNLAKVIEAGARRVVIVSGLLQASDPAEYARSAKKLLISDL